MGNGFDMIAYCGLTCESCPIYSATRQADKKEQARMRREILRLLHDQYRMELELKDITDCDGCRTDGERLFSRCRHCPIRQCARQKNLPSCANCPDYACENLEAFFRSDPSAKNRLDGIRKSAA